MKEKTNLKITAFVILFCVSFLPGIFLGLSHKNRHAAAPLSASSFAGLEADSGVQEKK